MSTSETICQFIDAIVDEYLVTRKKIRVDFYKYLQSENVDRRSINEYASNHIVHVEDLINEVDGALEGDEILIEAYSNFKKSELREFKSILCKFTEDVYRYKESKKIVRKKKKKSPDQLVRGLHLQSEPLIIEGKKYIPVPSEEIIDSKSIFLFNVTTHDLLFLTGKSLSCKGAKILSYDENLSGLKKSKKVSETLQKVLNTQLINCATIFDSLPNKKRPVPRTVSNNYILLKVLK